MRPRLQLHIDELTRHQALVVVGGWTRHHAAAPHLPRIRARVAQAPSAETTKSADTDYLK